MKLILCVECHDVVRLIREERECLCGKSGGRYLEDFMSAEYWGEAVPIGFDNRILSEAVEDYYKTKGKRGRALLAWVCDKKSKSFKRRGKCETNGDSRRGK